MLADDLRALAPQTTRWFEMDAARVKAFADATEDWQFIHLDEDRAKAETPFGGCVTHGFLTLSMLSAMSYQVVEGIEGFASSINYGFDRIRFVSPVRVGSSIRGEFTVASVDEGDGFLDVHWDVLVEVKGQDRPALAANWITRVYLAEGQ
ncbi:MaoC family dehydratase [Tropicibacter naphthalenivorans]|uniref:Putative enoyl-CoA hydratase 1 n=1 Tax=Tropicibacter naphthalenivorans TaxID=441103 RepID=A0A0P1GRZ6_9RHOB|nr:MaoC family dehydratase [Tropicibacter naphthalenivorans]CUH77941.1 putative enoyl-CoA hydratase 1 [Tropicibacter naphthalenivorans]SMC94998.1 Acyl dehydratase [Tropicibacter naphthalenivorans]